MNRYKEILQKLENKVPFAFNRFNDGEMKGILQPGCVVSRGDQVVTKDLSDMLTEALKHSQENYIKGKPCSVCFPEYDMIFYRINSDDNVTNATVLINRNYTDFMIKAPGLFQKYDNIYWIGNSNHNVTKLEQYLNVKIQKLVSVSAQNAWADFNAVKHLYKKIKDNSLVLLSCGVLERVLVYYFFKHNPNSTYLSIGSMFDPLTRNVYHKYHKNVLKPCSECN